jgi:hypothetical protein
MKALLICPCERPAVTNMAESGPLVLWPILGKSLVEYGLEHLASLGAKQVLILSADRPEQVRRVTGNGARWGLAVEVIPESRELTPEEARRKYRAEGAPDWLAAPHDVMMADRLPGLPQRGLFDSYGSWFAALLEWMPRAATPERIGMREVQPGLWVGLHTRVSPRATLHAPCWLGHHVHVGPEAVIGPGAILEDRVLVESGAEITGSLVGPETFVGQLTQIKDSLAWGSQLINWREGSFVRVPDAFLLCAFNARHVSPHAGGWWGRLMALLVMALTLPLGLWAAVKSWWRGQPALRSRIAVRPQLAAISGRAATVTYYEFADANAWWRRWPQLWSIARGDFTWVGNRPLSPSQAPALANDFERLWLAAPTGLISLADVEASEDSFNDETRAHASFYAAQAGWRLNLSILARALMKAVFGISFSKGWEVSPLPVASPLMKEKA